MSYCPLDLCSRILKAMFEEARRGSQFPVSVSSLLLVSEPREGPQKKSCHGSVKSLITAWLGKKEEDFA